jgi:carbon monoxide dehydrogenase subunit G
MKVKSREVGGQGHANADVSFALGDGGGTIHTAAQITGKAASMGEGVVVSVLDGLIKDFTQRLQAI